MSWDKNTIVNSFLEPTLRVLQKTNTPYALSVRGEVVGNGLNDFGDAGYTLQRLQYGDIVIVEQMERTCDCDVDDTLFSIEFPLIEEPQDLPLEVFACVCGNDCYGERQE